MFMVQHFSCSYIAVFSCSVLQFLGRKATPIYTNANRSRPWAAGCYAFYTV